MDALSVRFRRYEAEDRARCLELFDSNTPAWFAPWERANFETLLDSVPDSYFVMLDECNEICACGGVEEDAAIGTGWLTWGMVDATRHKRKLGTALVEYRLGLLRGREGVKRVAIDTSHLAAPFYERFGFVTLSVIRDGYCLGLHRHEMELALRAGEALPEEA